MYLSPYYCVRLIFLVSFFALSACNETTSTSVTPEEQAKALVQRMSLREKIGQKLMMAFPYWCEDNTPNCREGFLSYNDTVGATIAKNKLGGIILFASNLTHIDQATQLIAHLNRAAKRDDQLGLLVAIDQEGGNVVRLPRNVATSLPGNMALGAAYEATHEAHLAYKAGQVLAAEIRQVGFNVNLAPVIDVNSNPLNPVINVRAFSDSPDIVRRLGNEMAKGIASQSVVPTFKHFPGHGNTVIDSHYDLPTVTSSREVAYATDLAPFRAAVQPGQAMSIVMSAHIQYPALDSSYITTKNKQQIIRPATLSRVIQHNILRKEIGFRGVSMTDALNMQGIAAFFDPDDAVIKAFQADVDIALMPVTVSTPSDAHALSDLIERVVDAVNSGQINQAELDRSVERIILLKLQHNIVSPQPLTLSYPAELPNNGNEIGNPTHKAIEQDIVRKSITLIKNANHVLPLNLAQKKVHIATPWQEQADAMKKRFDELGYTAASTAKLSRLSWPEQQAAIDEANIVIVGTTSTAPPHFTDNSDVNSGIQKSLSSSNPFAPGQMLRWHGSLVFNVEEDFTPLVSSSTEKKMVTRANEISDSALARRAMEYAKSKQKTVIHLTMRAPYDVVSYEDVADATIATYSYYGYEGYLRGPTLPAAVDIMLGRLPALGRLPVALWEIRQDGSLGSIKYPRGFGLKLPALGPN